ncbi:hypothetical protein BYT27DRAFT_7197557 [Phlegmacium glaucopus]|nr:hypothetical protein BYT27DRAFT_7197557 [Phlegmacium glaucopus]
MDFSKDLNINDGHASGPSPAAAAPEDVAPTRELLHEGLFDKINDALNRVPKSKSGNARPPKPISILDKIGGHIMSSAAAAPTPPPTASLKQESFLDKIGDALQQIAIQSSLSTAPPIANDEPEGLYDKIGDLLHGGNETATLPAPEKDEGLLDKVADDIMGKKDEPPAKPDGLLEIDPALGGEAAAEKKEDKTINPFQE